MEELKKGEIVIYKSSKGPEIEVKFEKETIWLTQNQIASLFGTQRPAITKHINNIFKEKELNRNSVSSVLEHTASDGKLYKTQFYNLDAVVSIGYRVNSKRATQFRIWATKTLKSFLERGYAVNEKRLLAQEDKLREVQQTISFLQEKSKHRLLSGQEQEILRLLSNYSKTLTLLNKYDEDKLSLKRGGRGRFILDYDEAVRIIFAIKKDLSSKRKPANFSGRNVIKN